VTIITAGAVSTAGTTGRAAFFTGARLGLALATVRFVAAFPRTALDGFLTLGRALAPIFLWTFDDCFLRLAMIGSPGWYSTNTLMRDQKTTGPESRQPTLRVINSRVVLSLGTTANGWRCS
jgi:hypothetical protein